MKQKTFNWSFEEDRTQLEEYLKNLINRGYFIDQVIMTVPGHAIILAHKIEN